MLLWFEFLLVQQLLLQQVFQQFSLLQQVQQFLQLQLVYLQLHLVYLQLVFQLLLQLSFQPF